MDRKQQFPLTYSKDTMSLVRRVLSQPTKEGVQRQTEDDL